MTLFDTIQSFFENILVPTKKNVVLRVTSPYWLPTSPDWVLISNDVNATLSCIKGMIKDDGSELDSESIQWGRIPNHN